MTEYNSYAASSKLLHQDTIGIDDVLLGRGGRTNSHIGNKRYRTIVADYQSEYLEARKKDKILIARRIVALVKERGGRFLKQGPTDQTWMEVPDKRATEKTSQALREGLDVRNKTIRPHKMIRRDSDSTGSASALAMAGPLAFKLKTSNMQRRTNHHRLNHAHAHVVSGTVVPIVSPVDGPTKPHDADLSSLPEIPDLGDENQVAQSSNKTVSSLFPHYQPPPISQAEVRNFFEV